MIYILLLSTRIIIYIFFQFFNKYFCLLLACLLACLPSANYIIYILRNNLKCYETLPSKQVISYLRKFRRYLIYDYFVRIDIFEGINIYIYLFIYHIIIILLCTSEFYSRLLHVRLFSTNKAPRSCEVELLRAATSKQ